MSEVSLGGLGLTPRPPPSIGLMASADDLQPTAHMVLVLTEYHGAGTRLMALPSTVVLTQTPHQVTLCTLGSEGPPYRVPGRDPVNIIGEARAPSKRFFRGMRSACRVAVG